MHKASPAAKRVPKAQKKQKKAVTKAPKRKMTAFAGKTSEPQDVFATGVIKRTQGGKVTEVPMALEFTATPELNIVAATQHRFIPGSALTNSYTEAYLVDAKGESAKLKAITAEPVITDGSVKFTGPTFAWTKAAVSSTLADGGKLESNIDFAKDNIKFTLKVAAKNAADSLSEEGTFTIVERSQFYDFVRVTKSSFESQSIQAQSQDV